MSLASKIKVMTVAVSVALLSACGGGAGGGYTGTVVNGQAQAGVFTIGQAVFKGYSGADLNKEYTLKTVTFAAADRGKFSANLGRYSGPLKIEVSGSYTDEATGKQVTVSPNRPLRSALPSTSVTNGITLPVTPLTDISVTMAGANGVLSDSSVTACNAAVSYIFGFDIIKIVPVAADATALAAVSDAKVRMYTAALVTISQYVANYTVSASTVSGTTTANVSSGDLSAALPNALDQISSGVTVSGTGTTSTASIMDATVAFTLKRALTDAASNPQLPAGVAAALTTAATTVTNAISANTDSAVKSVLPLKFRVSGTLPANTAIGSIHFAMNVPQTVTLNTAADGALAAGTATATGTGFGSGVEGKVANNVLSLSIASVKGFGTGIFATLYYTAPSAITIATDTFTSLKITDLNGVSISGLTVSAE